MATHVYSRNITPFDSRWVVPSALSLLHQGNLDLDEYKDRLEANSYYAAECVEPGGRWTYLVDKPRDVQRACAGHYHYYYPLAVPVLTAPVLWGVEAALTIARPALRVFEKMAPAPNPFRHALATGDLDSIWLFTELGAACLFIAMGAVLVYFLCREYLERRWAVALTLVFAFATPAWSTGSRGLWQHTLSMPLLAAALWLLAAARRRPSLAAWAGLPLMTAFWVRPTNVISLGIFSLYVLVFYRKQFAGFLIAMIPPVLLFGGITYSIYGSLLAPYANAGRASAHLTLHAQFLEAVAGILWSPARGLFIFVPLLLLIPFAWRPASATRAGAWLHWAVLAVLPFHTLLIASFVDWWGGHCFGPRFFADLCPLLIFLCIPLALRIRAGNRPLAAAACLLLAYGVFIHWRGANSSDVLDWNVKPVEIRQAQWRIWDWSDLSFLRGLR